MEGNSSKGVKLAGLWRNEKDGVVYLSGPLGNARVCIFPNKFRKGDKEPSHVMMLCPNEKRDSNGQAREPGGTEAAF